MTDDYDDYDYYFEAGECGNCGGDGYVFDCWDGCCKDADIGCRLCTSRCDWCNPGKPNPEIQKIVADALAEQFDSEARPEKSGTEISSPEQKVSEQTPNPLNQGAGE